MFEAQLEGEYAKVAKVQEKEQEGILAKANVVGVGVGHKISGGQDTGDTSLTVFVEQKMDPASLSKDDLIPAEVGKYKTDVVESGVIFAGGAAAAPVTQEGISIQTLKWRVRPVEGGYSVAHEKVTAGTYATAVTDRSPYPGIPRRYYVLSNNHVLANSNNAQIGDPILQPGPFDGGTYPQDMIARLSRFVPIRFNDRDACNYVDAAIAEGPFQILDREIYWIGYVKGVANAQVGMLVQKTGRTTNYTTGRVTAINGTFTVNYGGGRWARFCRQIVTTNMSAGGDSGSLLCDLNENAVGLLFAGSTTLTLHNHIGFVQALLGIRVV